MKKKCGLPVVEVGGKPFDMGKQAGSKCARQGKAYRTSIAESIKHSTGMSWEKAVMRAKLYLPMQRRSIPISSRRSGAIPRARRCRSRMLSRSAATNFYLPAVSEDVQTWPSMAM